MRSAKRSSRRDRPRKRVGESSVIVDNVPVKNLRTGTYSMVVSLLDRDGKPSSSASRKLYVYNETLGHRFDVAPHRVDPADAAVHVHG